MDAKLFKIENIFLAQGILWVSLELFCFCTLVCMNNFQVFKFSIPPQASFSPNSTIIKFLVFSFQPFSFSKLFDIYFLSFYFVFFLFFSLNLLLQCFSDLCSFKCFIIFLYVFALMAWYRPPPRPHYPLHSASFFSNPFFPS